MTLRIQWGEPAGATLTTINWKNGFGSAGRFDPYLAWLDLMIWPVKRDASGTMLILELRSEYTVAAHQYLKKMSVWITPHYRSITLPNGSCPRFVTAHVRGPDGLATLAQRVASGSDPWVLRYEVSIGFASPDASVFFDWVPAMAAGAPAGGATGPVVGFIDYGCPFLHRQFLDCSGNTRVKALWDPTWKPGASKLCWVVDTRFGRGGTVDAQAIDDHRARHPSNGVTDEVTAYAVADYPQIMRYATHGAHIMDIATGFPDPTVSYSNPILGPSDKGKQHGHAIVFAQLPRGDSDALGSLPPRAQIFGLLRAQVLDAAHFVALHLAKDQPGVINLSYGSNCGPHDGSSILERALDELIESHGPLNGAPRLHCVIPSGNSLDQSLHVKLTIAARKKTRVTWHIAPDDPSDSFVEVWVADPAAMRVRVATPNGVWSAPVQAGQLAELKRDNKVIGVLAASGKPCQSESGGMCLLAIASTTSTLRGTPGLHGPWTIELENVSNAAIEIDAWSERDDPVFGQESGPRQAYFEPPVACTGTLNSIAHGRRTTVVSGYHIHDTAAQLASGPVASMAGTGPGRGLTGRDRHDSSAGAPLPGPEVYAPCSLAVGEEGLPAAGVLSGDQVRLTGTSVAAAYWTRKLIENGFMPPAFYTQGPLPPLPDRNDHPDDPLPQDRLR